MASTRIYRTAGTPTSTKKFTISFWVKKTGLGADQFIFSSFTDASNRFQIQFNTDDQLDFICKVSGSNVVRLKTNRDFRDTASFYHIVAVLDTTQSTADDRIKFYVNGVQETSFATRTNPSQDADVNVSGTHTIGAYHDSGSPSLYFDGILSHIHFTDGYTYQASTFGSTDSTTGEWEINTGPSITMGTNGFSLKMEDSSNLDLDSSSNAHSFTTAGTLTATPDCPSNSFAIINKLNPNAGENISFSAGNTSINSAGGAHRNAPTTFYLPLGNGKFYWEMKVDRMSTHVKVGLVYDEWDKLNKPTPAEEHSGSNQGYSYRSDGQKENNGATSFGNSYTAGDIIGIAFDTENRNLYYAKNGTWQNSGDPTSGASGTGKAFTVDADYVYAPIVNLYDADVSFNFGNGYFETTAISSEGTNASSIGKFEYDVPAGYTALSTKGFNL